MSLLVLAALAGCERPAAKKQALPPSFVRIMKLAPDPATPLRVGDKVKLEVEVNYALTTADSGTLAVVVQAADDRNLAQNAAAIRKGAGKAALGVEFVVPQTSAVRVFTPLSPQGQSATSTVALRTYKVLEK
jgi:glucan biosynthesis protein